MARLRFTNRYPVCDKVTLPVDIFSANGEKCLNCLCQLRGQAQIEVNCRPVDQFVNISPIFARGFFARGFFFYRMNHRRKRVVTSSSAS